MIIEQFANTRGAVTNALKTYIHTRLDTLGFNWWVVVVEVAAGSKFFVAKICKKIF